MIPCAVVAKVPESPKHFTLIESLDFQKAEEVITADHPALLKKDKKVKVVGRQRSSSLDGQAKVLQVIWTGLQNDKKQHAAFDKPFITVVQSANDSLPKDVELPFEGDLKQLEVAYEKLKSGKVNLGKEVKADNPESDGRRVDEGDSASQRNSLNGQDGLGQVGAGLNQGSSDSASANGSEGFDGKEGSPKGDKGGSPAKNGSVSTQARGSSIGGNRGGYGSGNSGMGREGFGAQFQPASASSNSSQGSTAEKDTKTVEGEDCDPRVDETQERVYLQSRTINKTNGQVTSRGQCKDRMKFFDIKKDYNAEGCSDYVNHLEKNAYDRYRKYWVDARGERHYLGDRIYVADDNPRPFIDEKGNCHAYIDRDAMTAHPQVETVYYGRGNTRIVVEACHKDMSLTPVRITEANQGCTPRHDLESSTSQELKRGVYQLGDVEHEAFSCRVVGDPLPHQFDSASPCKGIKNMCTKEIMLTGKRYIVLSDGSKVMISGECEPFGDNIALEFSTIGCAGYHHDIEAGKSFANGKWFYRHKGQKQEVSKCVAGPMSFVHQTELKGYDHDDSEKLSYAKQHIWIEVEGEKINIDLRKTRYDLPGIPYQFLEDRVAKSKDRSPYFEGCYQFLPQDKFKVFKRCDDTEYLSFLSTSVEKKSENKCQVRHEQKRCREYLIDIPLVYGGGQVHSWVSHSFLAEDEDLPGLDTWKEFQLDNVSAYHRGAKFHWVYHDLFGGWTSLYGVPLTKKPEMTLLEEQVLRKDAQMFHDSAVAKNNSLNTTHFVGGTYAYYRKGFRMRDVTIFPDGSVNEGSWEHTADASWIPYGLYRDEGGHHSNYMKSHFVKSSTRSCFPGAQSKMWNMGNSYVHTTPGPNRVNN